MRLIALVLLGLMAAMPAAAHRQPEVEITIVPVSEQERDILEITHRLHASDAMNLLRALGEQNPQLSDPAQQARIAAHARDHLDLSGKAESRILGAELEGNYLYIYQLHPERAELQGSAIYADLIPGWSNRVQIKNEGGRTVRTVTFHGDYRSLSQGEAPPLPATKHTHGH
ncbi:DUF6702 family protein [Parvularcula oceani]|uniref:DUF6702 family protein n=1 Tax=Parvularcula oceani TaxID=1247963 RepID=UPI0004E1CFA4|nr:DUF6702 family protein [Parvularcula oceani]